jgi:hypothetical protein
MPRVCGSAVALGRVGLHRLCPGKNVHLPLLCTFLFLLLPALAWAEPPAIRWQPANKSEAAFVEVTGIDSATLAQWREQPPKDWPAIFAVHVGDSRTAILGSYLVSKTGLRFEPRFPFSPGSNYRAVYTPPSGQPVMLQFAVPKPSVAATTVLEHVYPTRSELPENQLKFYLHFSTPMSRGGVYDHIHLIDDKGKEVERPFLELEEELWDPASRRFTLFIQPGRIKRGLKPREDLGPALVEGKKFTLVVDAGWNDAAGNPLKAEFRKTFSVGKPDETQPDPKNWKMQTPVAGSKAALKIHFPKPLDHALLHRMLWVLDDSGKKIAGNIEVKAEETVWLFTPQQIWMAGQYRLVIDTALEDLAGNSIARPFEVDEFHPIEKELKVKTVELSFQVR